MNKKVLIIIGVLTLVGCNNSLSSISLTSSSFIDMRTDEEKNLSNFKRRWAR